MCIFFKIRRLIIFKIVFISFFIFFIFNKTVISKDELGENQIKLNRVNLGGWLFYENRLSLDNSMSCGSCHKKEFAFGDTVRFNKGIHGNLLTRNTISLMNLIATDFFFRDGRINKLESQVSMPIVNPKELDSNFPLVISRLEKDKMFKKMFISAYGSSKIDSARIVNALASFVRTLVTYDSKADSNLNNEKYRSYDSEKLNEVLLSQYSPKVRSAITLCQSCHNKNEFGGHELRNNGLPVLNGDSGLYNTTKLKEDIGKFKVPSLRNVSVTFPYMHDGRYRTLNDVIEYYNSQIPFSDNLDSKLLKDGKPIRLNLNDNEKKELLLFLESLTEQAFLKAPRMSIH